MALHCISAPEGLATPRLLSIDDTTLRIVWTAPERPNGEVTGYFIYLDGTKIDTEMTTPGSYLLQNLRPYTVYTIQVREFWILHMTNHCKEIYVYFYVISFFDAARNIDSLNVDRLEVNI